jgi:hypothetical protein
MVSTVEVTPRNKSRDAVTPNLQGTEVRYFPEYPATLISNLFI